MIRGRSERAWLEVDEFVEAYELAWRREAAPKLADFLPPPGHPQRREVWLELVRVDLELRWDQGCPKALDDYRHGFPDLLDDPQSLAQVAFEEYRMRRQAGEEVTAEEYGRRYGIPTQDWPTLSQGNGTSRSGSIPATTDSPLSSADDTPLDFPEIGTDLLGFHLQSELGRGAFSRVYLARQGDLANRLVALKVSTEFFAEADKLAQLQHAHIVPIYSVHRAGELYAVCMPFFGSTTLADVLRELQGKTALPPSGKALVATVTTHQSVTRRSQESVPGPSAGIGDAPRAGHVPTGAAADISNGKEPAAPLRTLAGLTYVEAVLWIGARLADGLAHAHERGILHRDLKPANVLLADDGQPMLLDFNLSEDLKLRGGVPAAFVGGTLSYMAPEQLLAFQRSLGGGDARSDLFSLGVILYEMLTGRQAFPAHQGPLDELISRQLQDRLQPPPRVRGWPPAVSPAVESLVRHCLEPDLRRRYQTASELHEDLERHLKHLPLRYAREPSLRERARKWVCRHPRVTSATSIAILAATLFAGLGALFVVRGERLARWEAAEAYHQFQNDLRAAQIECLEAPTSGQTQLEAITASCRRALDHFQVLDNANWQETPSFQRLSVEHQQRLRADAGELLFLMAALTRLHVESLSTLSQRESESRRAVELNERAESCYPSGRVPGAVWHQRGLLVEQLGQPAEAKGLLERAAATPPQSPRDRCLLACLYAAQRRFREALPLWQQATFEDPQNIWAWYGLGNCYDRLDRPAQAAACYSACIALKPDFHGWYFNRGLAQLKQQEYALAGADFDEALRLQPGHAESLVNRALARLGERRSDAAIQDLTEAIRLGQDQARVYLLLAQARERAGDMAGAQRDRQQGLQRAPADEAAWIARGVARSASDSQAALADFDRALACNALSLAALESKAHVLAEQLSRTEEAVQVLDRAAAFYPEYAPTVAARGVLLARLGRREAARQDAEKALSLDPTAPTAFQVAGIYALLSQQEPGDRLRCLTLLATALRQNYGAELMDTDKDLDFVREDPQFRQLLEAVQAFQTISPHGPRKE